MTDGVLANDHAMNVGDLMDSTMRQTQRWVCRPTDTFELRTDGTALTASRPTSLATVDAMRTTDFVALLDLSTTAADRPNAMGRFCPA